jgi:hypothetical protein
VFVHLPVVSEEERQAYASNVVAAVRAAQPARVVFSTSGFDIDDAESAASTLARGLADSGVSHAVVAPELYLENLLMPHVVDAGRERGVLRYPLRADFAVSWASHLDIADAVVALFESRDVTGVVSVGSTRPSPDRSWPRRSVPGSGGAWSTSRSPPRSSAHRWRPCSGTAPQPALRASYQAMDALPGRSIDPERSAQKLLGVTSRTTVQWLSDINLR